MLSLEHLNSVFEISPVPSVVLQPDAPVFTIAAANRAFLQLTRTLNQDIIGKGLFEVFPQQEDEYSARRKKSVTSALDHVLYLKKPHKLGLIRYDLQGAENYETRFWNIDSYPLLNAEGEVQFIIQHPVDITTHILSGSDQNNFQSNLLQEQHLQHAFFKDYPDGIFTLDLKGNFLNANQVLLDLAECSEEDLLRLSFVSFIDISNYDVVFKYFQNAAQGKRQNFDIPIITAKGNRRILNLTTLPIKIGNEISAIYLVAKDISALKDAEQQIEDKNQRIFNILESITDAFFAVDRNWTVNHWNKEAEKILGMPRENILGKNLWEVYQDAIPLKFYNEYHLAVAENKTVTFEDFFPPLQKWFEVSAYPSVDGLSVYFKDITPRKQAEEELRQANERHYALFNFSPLPKWVYDIETLMVIHVNEAAITNYGFSREEFLAMNIRDLWPVEDLSQCDEMIETRVKCHLPNRGIHRHVKKNGEVINVEFQSQPLPSWGKNARITTALDVTEKMKAEEALQISERRFKSLVQDGSDLIAILDPVGNYQYVSPTSMTVLGLEPEFFLGKNAFDFIHQEDMARVMDQFNLLTTQKRVQVAPFRFKNKKQEYQWIETIITDCTSDPAIGGIIANSRDVTQNIRDNLKIKENIERYNVVSKATSDAIYDWDLIKNEGVWNKGIVGIFGHRRTGSTTIDWWLSMVHPEDVERVAQKIHSNLQNKKSRWKDEYRFRCADYSYKHVLDRGFIIYNDAGEAIRMIGAIQDITDRVNHIKAIEEQNQRLQEIAWTQSHVVRAPVARILGLSELMKGNDHSMIAEFLPFLIESTQELDQVIREIVKKTEMISVKR